MRNRMTPSLPWTAVRIKELRRSYGLTQDEFARLVRVGLGTLRCWEQGQGNGPSGPATYVLDDLAERFEQEKLTLQSA